MLTGLLHEAIRAADPAAAISSHLPSRPKGRTVVIGAGKASAHMAQALECVWDSPMSGLVVTRYGHSVPTRQIEIVEAAHPIPDEAGQAAAERIVDLLRPLDEDDLVIALISGGGSALLPAPFGELTLDDERQTNRALLNSGMPIGAMNKIRNELSFVKGGRLAMIAHPARVHTFVVSDVAGDDPAMIASGPTIPMETSREEARRLVELYGISLPNCVQTHLEHVLFIPVRSLRRRSSWRIRLA
ncbi:hypothetical protein GCM10011390_50700 [Aureimonas endophytica]|uniref:MOFRL-associated domain-containing protein n=2 Tax=Aureimonas endophytica TaxID=2027858 RepID=A0A917EDH4_9HYPH|nr:hypothetical protein GCM10011390_50700 [Aureimonas endophytica]